MGAHRGEAMPIIEEIVEPTTTRQPNADQAEIAMLEKLVETLLAQQGDLVSDHSEAQAFKRTTAGHLERIDELRKQPSDGTACGRCTFVNTPGSTCCGFVATRLFRKCRIVMVSKTSAS